MNDRATPNKFMTVFKSDVRLGDTVSDIKLNLAGSELTFTATETPEYKWTDWLIQLPQDESITLFLMDDQGKHRCILVMEELYIHEHTLPVHNVGGQFGLDTPYNLEHKVTVTFSKIERLKQYNQAVVSHD